MYNQIIKENKHADNSDFFNLKISENRDKLMNHTLFKNINNVAEMQIFMQMHVFAVWDFMSLLKSLQNQLTCTTVPWMPPANREAARFMNEIVVCEETDEVVNGQYISHFELYLDAMEDCGADLSSINRFIDEYKKSLEVVSALNASKAPDFVKKFVMTTMSFCKLKPHEVAAAFLYGREDVIPDMFKKILSDTDVPNQDSFSKIKLYLQRHIDIDGDSHGPMAHRLINSLCGNDLAMWNQVADVANKALEARIQLWDGVLSLINIKKENYI